MSTRLTNICACPTHIAPYHVCGQSPRYPDDIPAGRELDALVAELIMGFWSQNIQHSEGAGKWRQETQWHTSFGTRMNGLPNYSTNIAAAWEILPALQNAGLSCFGRFCENLMERFEGDEASANVTLFNVLANLTPLAICRAALEAKGVP